MITAVTRTAHRWRAGLPPLDRGRTVRSMVAFGLSFGAVTAVGGVHHGIFAAMGCYIDAYGARDPYPRRGPLLACLSAAFVVAFVAGSAAAGDVWTMVGVLSVVAVAATVFVRTLRLSGPGSYFVILVAALAAFLPPAGPADTAVRAGCLALGAALSWAAGMSGWLSGPYEPEERAVAAAFRSVATFADAQAGAGTGKPPADLTTAGRAAQVAAHAAWVALDGARGSRGDRGGHGDRRDREGRGRRGEWGDLGDREGQDGRDWRDWRDERGGRDGRDGRRVSPAPRRVRLYALMTGLEVLLDSVQSAAERGDAPVSAELPVRLRAAAAEIAAGRWPEEWPGDRDGTRELLEVARGMWPVPLPPRRSVGAGLRRLLSPSSPDLPVALRVGLAVAVGTVMGSVLPLLHPAWVAVGAAAALQGGPGQQPAQRAQARLVGTVAGVAVTALVFHSYQPGTWVTVAVATVAHAVSRGVPPGALFVRTMLNTPVALLLVDTASSAGLGTLAAFRLLDLTLGLALGVAAALLVRGVPRRRVCAAVANAVAATGDALRERLRTGAVRPASEGASWLRMAELWDMYAAVPAEEIRTTGTADRLWPTVLAVRRLLSWTVLGGPMSSAPAPSPDDAARIGRHVEALARAARAGLPGSPALRAALPGPPPPPAPAHDQELHRRLVTLGSALMRSAPEAQACPGPGQER